MIVADASVVIELLVFSRGPAGGALGRRVARQEPIYAPHLVDAEVGQVLRRFVLHGQLSATQARVALDRLRATPLFRSVHAPLLPRAFELRSNVTVYDGLYLALAEALDAPLLTTDGALANVPGCRARVEVLPSTPPARGPR